MRKSIYLIILISVFLLSSGSLYAADLKDGFFDIRWKTNLSQIAGFKKIRENLSVSYFTNPERVYTIGDVRISDVVYGCYADQFFAVYINIETIEVFSKLRRHMNQQYGLPEIIRAMPSEQTTYQWRNKRVKIKLKIYENRNNMKLAFYYAPLSRQVNEAQQEAFRENFKSPVFPMDERRMKNAIDLMELNRKSPPSH